MLSIILGVVLLIALCEAAVFRSRWIQQIDRTIEAGTEAERYEDMYRALEIGMDEQAESYEMQILSLQEMIDDLQIRNRGLLVTLADADDVVQYHQKNCLGANLPINQ